MNRVKDAEYWHLDVSQESQVQQVFTEVEDKWGKVDVLVNNAGISGVDKPTHEITAQEWNKLMVINVNRVFFCTKYAIPMMMKLSSGSIINLSSMLKTKFGLILFIPVLFGHHWLKTILNNKGM